MMETDFTPMVLWLAQTKSRFVVSSNEESSSTQASTIVDLIFNAFPFTAFITILSYKKVLRSQGCEARRVNGVHMLLLDSQSWDEPWKLWYVVLELKNMVMTQGNMLQAELMFPNPERI
ncbi:hypothetical protein YC2023_095841 [Brassica napus]